MTALQAQVKNIIVKLFNKSEVQFIVTAAGLEPRIIKSFFPNIETIAIPINLVHVHTYQEKVEIKSTKNAYELVQALIDELN